MTPTTTSPPPSADPGHQLWTVRLMLVAIVALMAAVFSADGLFDSWPQEQAWALVLGCQAPFLVALWLLRRGATPVSLGVSAGFTLGLLIALVPLTLGSWLSAGFINDFTVPSLMVALLMASAVLLATARAGLRNPPPAAGRASLGAPWFLAASIMAVGWMGGIMAMEQWLSERHKRLWIQARTNERAAREMVQRIVACARSFAQAHAGEGYPETLERLGAIGCAAGLKQGIGNGFRFQYFASPPDPSGRRHTFTVCAQPLRYRVTGWMTFVGDDTGLELGDHTPAPKRAGPISCGHRWSSDAAVPSSIHYCLLEWAAAHPQAGFPGGLQEMRGCTSDPRGWEYVPGPIDSRGMRWTYGLRRSGLVRRYPEER